MIHNTKTRTVLALALGWIAAGWSGVYAAEEASWADVKEAFVVEGEDGVTYMAFSREALRRAGKKPVKAASVATADAGSVESAAVDLSAEETRSVTKTFKKSGKGTLFVLDENDANTGADDIGVHLIVPNGALSEKVQITMTVYGNYLSDLVVAFQPGGLVFNKDASLLVEMGGQLVDVDAGELKVWHEYEDGAVEETGLAIYQGGPGNFLELSADVSGFSRYGIRRGF